MKILSDLYIAASEFEHWLEMDVEILKEHRYKMYEEKDIYKIKDILKTLISLEHDTARYKEWAEREAEALEKLTEP